jgi:hypothetical protein
MFIGKSLYENAPYYWIVLGVLLIVFGFYYGNAGNQEFFLAGLGGGAFACVWGLFIVKRRLAQEARKPCATYDEYLDQTMELNVRNLPPTSRPTPADTPAPE